MSEMMDPKMFRDVVEKVVNRMLLQMEIYNKTLQFRHPRLLSQIAKGEKSIPPGLARALTRLSWQAKHFSKFEDHEESQKFSDLLYSVKSELIEPYADMYQAGMATDKDVFMGEPDENRIKLLDATRVTDDVMKELGVEEDEDDV